MDTLQAVKGKGVVIRIILITLVMIVTQAHSEDLVPPHWKHFGFEQRGSNRKLMMNVPEVALSPAEWDRLAAGEPVTRLIDSPGEYKVGYLRFFATIDPVTAWMVGSE
jgi:hypothetical protein